jgi:hypothetical protein
LSRRDKMVRGSGKGPQNADILDNVKKSCNSAVGNPSSRAMSEKETAWRLKYIASDNMTQHQARK